MPKLSRDLRFRKKAAPTLTKFWRSTDKSLYRFHKFENGEFKSEEGTCSPADMPPGTISQVAEEAKNVKLTGCALQAGRYHKPKPFFEHFSKTSTMAALRIEKMTDLPQLEKVLQDNQKDNR